MNKKIEAAIENFLTEDETVHLPDGMDEAFVGIARQFNIPFAVYDRQKCIELLMKDMDSFEEAEEYFNFNISSSYLGGGTPAFIEIPDEEPF
jgi:hypothetical protein